MLQGAANALAAKGWPRVSLGGTANVRQNCLTLLSVPTSIPVRNMFYNDLDHVGFWLKTRDHGIAKPSPHQRRHHPFLSYSHSAIRPMSTIDGQPSMESALALPAGESALATSRAVSAPRPLEPALPPAAQAWKAYDYRFSLPQGLTRGDERDGARLFSWEGNPVAQVPGRRSGWGEGGRGIDPSSSSPPPYLLVPR